MVLTTAKTMVAIIVIILMIIQSNDKKVLDMSHFHNYDLNLKGAAYVAEVKSNMFI